MNVEDIIKATNGKLLTGNLEEQCENFCTDTRKIQNGDVYVGLKGEKFNGNEYYKEALEKGAKVVVISGIKIADEELKQYKDKVSIKVIENGKTFKDSKGRIIHFCIADAHMYRLEYNTEKRKAECNFNDIKECQLLDELFCSVFSNNTLSRNEVLA